jgi:hypothetical protein
MDGWTWEGKWGRGMERNPYLALFPKAASCIKRVFSPWTDAQRTVDERPTTIAVNPEVHLSFHSASVTLRGARQGLLCKASSAQ